MDKTSLKLCTKIVIIIIIIVVVVVMMMMMMMMMMIIIIELIAPVFYWVKLIVSTTPRGSETQHLT